MRSFLTGFWAAFKGINYTKKHKNELKKAFWASILINTLILIAIIVGYIYGVHAGFESLTDWLTSKVEVEEDSAWDYFINAIAIGLEIGLIVILVFILPYLYTTLSLIITSTFAGSIYSKIREIEQGQPIEESTFLSEVRVTLKSIGLELYKLLVILAINIVLLIINIIPVIGQAAFIVLDIYFISLFLAWDNLTPYFEQRRMKYKGQREVIKNNRFRFFGLGLGSLLLLYIPILQILFAFTNIVSTALLVLQLEKEEKILLPKTETSIEASIDSTKES